MRDRSVRACDSHATLKEKSHDTHVMPRDKQFLPGNAKRSDVRWTGERAALPKAGPEEALPADPLELKRSSEHSTEHEKCVWVSIQKPSSVFWFVQPWQHLLSELYPTSIKILSRFLLWLGRAPYPMHLSSGYRQYKGSRREMSWLCIAWLLSHWAGVSPDHTSS